MKILILLVFSALAYADSCQPPWSNSYTYCKAVVVNHFKVSTSDQADFVTGVFGTDTDLRTVGNGGFVQSASGFDIIFTSDQAGTILIPFERAVWSATTGLNEFWFKRTVSASVDTTIYMFFGNSAIMSDQQDKSGTWGPNYKGVWHMGDGTTIDLTDSSGNGNNGTNHGATACSGQIIGAACLVSASSQYIDVGNNSSLQITSAITVEAWVKYTNTIPPVMTVAPTILTNTSTAPFNGYFLYLHDNDGGGLTGKWIFGAENGGSAIEAGTALQAVQNTIYFLAGTYNSAGGTNNTHLYSSGADQNVTWGATAIGTSTHAITFSNWVIAPTPYWDGFLDEIRISNIQRTGSWLATELNNTNDPATFYTISSKVQNASSGRGRTIIIN